MIPANPSLESFKPRQFRNLGAALRWFLNSSGGPQPVRAIPIEPAQGSTTLEARDEAQATWAAILLALRDVKRADLLLEWHNCYSSDENFARDQGFPSGESFHRAMVKTEQTVRERLQNSGVLP